MLAARDSWVGPSFLSTIRQETPYRLSSAAMNRPTGPAPTTNTWVLVAIRVILSFLPVVPIQQIEEDSQRAVLDIRIVKRKAGRPTAADADQVRTWAPIMLRRWWVRHHHVVDGTTVAYHVCSRHDELLERGVNIIEKDIGD